MMAAVTLAIKIVAAATTYVFTFVLAHTMDINDFGVVGALLSATFLLSVLGVVGQRVVLLRFVPPYLGGEDRAGMTGIVNRAFQVAAIGTTAVFAVVSIATLVVGLLGYVEGWPILILGYLLIPLQGWIDMQAHLSRAYRSIVLALLPKEVLWRGITGVVIVAVFLVNGGVTLDLPIVVGLLVIVLLVLVVAQSLAMKEYLGNPPLSLGGHHVVPATWGPTVLPFWISSVSSIMFANVDVIVVGIMAGGEAAGLYFAANRVVQVLNFFLMSQTIVIGPMVSEAYARGKNDHVRRLVASATIQSAIPTIALAVVLTVAAPWIMGLFGSAFAQSVPILQILSVSVVFAVVLGPSDLIMNMCDRERECMIASAICIALGILLIFLGAWWGGLLGTAIGVLLARGIMKVVLWLLAWRLIGVPTDLFNATLIIVGKSARP